VEKLSGNGVIEEECLFTTPDLKAQNLEFGFGCEHSNYHDCYFGFAHIKYDQESPLKSQIQSLFKAKFRADEPNPKWPASAYWDQHRNWDDKTMAAILSGDFAKDLKVLIESLNEIATKAVKG